MPVSDSHCSPSVQHNISDSSQLIKRETSSLASYESFGKMSLHSPMDHFAGYLFWGQPHPMASECPHVHWALAVSLSITRPVAWYTQPSLVW